MNYVVIFAGGVGSRMGSSVPKQFLEVDNKPIIIHVVEIFAAHPRIDGIVIVSKKEYIDYCVELTERYGIKKILNIIPGGETGQESIFNGINELYLNHSQNPGEDIVLIHDGVRPLITAKLISDCIECAGKNGNSVTVSKAIETVIMIDDNGVVADTVDRSRCRNAKAPQCFRLQDIRDAHMRAKKENVTNMIDSATLMSYYGCTLHTIECDPENIKITTPNDYYMFKAVYEAKHSSPEGQET